MLQTERYFETLFLLFLLGLFLYIIKGFMFAFFLAITFVFLSYKYNKWLLSIVRKDYLAATITVVLILFAILLPIFLLFTALVGESASLFDSSSRLLQSNALQNCDLAICIKMLDGLALIDSKLETISNAVSGIVLSSYDKIFSYTSNLFVDLFIFILTFWFLLKDGDHFVVYLKKVLPMKDYYKEALFVRFRDVTSAVFVDTILIALLQGGLVGLGFWFLGFSSPVFWGLVASFFSLIPVLGAPVVWLPAVVFLFLTGKFYVALGLCLYGALVVGLSDNIIRPILINNKVNVHPMLIMLGIMGGLEAFGFFGLFLGPIIISLLVSVMDLYKLDFH